LLLGALTTDISYKGGALTVDLHGEIDHHTARSAREKIDKALYLYRPKKQILSLKEVSFMDSSGLGLILGRVSAAEAVSADVTLTNVPERARKILHMAGVERISSLTIEGD